MPVLRFIPCLMLCDGKGWVEKNFLRSYDTRFQEVILLFIMPNMDLQKN